MRFYIINGELRIFDIDRWRIRTQPPEVQIEQRRRYKAAGKMGRIVVDVRNLTVPKDRLWPEDFEERLVLERQFWDEVAEGKRPRRDPVKDAEECAHNFFSTLNAWRKERVRYFGREKLSRNLATNLLDERTLAELREGGADECDVAGRIACGHMCLTVHHVREAILALIAKKDMAEPLAKAIDEAVLTAYYARLRDGQRADPEMIREQYQERFAI